jgi:hypothetical protein
MQRDPALALLGTQQFDWPVAEFPDVSIQAGERFSIVSWEQLVVRTLIPVSSVMVRRDVIDRVGDFDVALRSSEDRDFFLRVAEMATVGILDMPLTGYRDTPGSMCKNPEVRERAMWQVMRKLTDRNGWRNRWLLRRKCYGSMYRECADVYARSGRHWQSVVRLLKSCVCYPLPYRSGEVRLHLDRPRRLAVNALRLLGLKRPDHVGSARPSPPVNAIQSRRDNTDGAIAMSA